MGNILKIIVCSGSYTYHEYPYNLQRRLAIFYEAFSDQWHTVNKPFGFEVHCARLGGVNNALRIAKKD